MKKVNVLIISGVIMIFIGMTLQLEQLIKDNIHKQEIIDSQAKELIKCKAETESLWDNYYMNKSEYKGEYYE